MRILTKLIAGTAAAVAATAIAAGPAWADPPGGVTPRETDVVGVGSDTIEFVFDQFSHDYNASHTTSSHLLYSWDATNPSTGAVGDPIATKAGCSTIARPDGSSAGISALDANAKTIDGTNFCIDYARSSRARSSSDPAFAPGGIAFVDLARDAVSYATQATTNAPANLTTAQLASIYNCTVSDWGQVGGISGHPIHAFIPQSGSGTRAFFLGAIGVANPGACVNQTVQENEGVNPLLNDPNAIVPFSIGKFIAEKFHSAACLNSSCTPVGGVVCTPAAGQNMFGCDVHGTMKLNSINGTKPTVGSGLKTAINSKYTPAFMRIVFEVVRYDATTADHIPAYLEPLFASSTAKVKGWVCTNKKAAADLHNYGFLATPLCGVTG